MEVALRLLQTLADPSAELEMAERWREAGMPDLRATLHNTVFKVCHTRLLGRDCKGALELRCQEGLSARLCSVSPSQPCTPPATNTSPTLLHCLMSCRNATLWAVWGQT